MEDFTGKVVLVTGGSKGIGQAVVRKFCQAGAHCVIVSRHGDECRHYAEQLVREGMAASGVVADVSKTGDIKAMVKTVVRLFGKIDVLVNSAGVNIRKLSVDYSEEDWDYIMNINLKGSYFCSVEVGKQMLAQGRGAIVNLASLQSHIALPRVSIYAASKGGIRQFTKGLANEWAAAGIRVNSVSPAFITTPLVAEVLKDPSWRQTIDSRTPMQRPGTPEEVANAVFFLASSQASYITGADIAIDGGWTAG